MTIKIIINKFYLNNHQIKTNNKVVLLCIICKTFPLFPTTRKIKSEADKPLKKKITRLKIYMI